MKKAPTHLSPPAARWFRYMAREYGIEDAGGVSLLSAAADAWDRCREAREIISAEGAITTDRFGQRVPHPAVRIEHGARAQLLAALRLLNLDLEPLQSRPGRPAGDPHYGG